MSILKKIFGGRDKVRELENSIKRINNRINIMINENTERYAKLIGKFSSLENKLSKLDELDELEEKVKKQEWIISHNKKFDINYLYNKIEKLVEEEVNIGYIITNKYLMEYYDEQLKSLIENDNVRLQREYISSEIVQKRIDFNFGEESIRVYLIEALDNDYNFKIMGSENKRGVKKGFASIYS